MDPEIIDSSPEFIFHKTSKRKVLSDILNSSLNDDIQTPPPLNERMKNMSTSLSSVSFKKDNVLALTSENSEEEFDELLEKIKTPFNKKKNSSVCYQTPPMMDDSKNRNIITHHTNTNKIKEIKQNIRSMRLSSSPKKHITPIRYSPVTFSRMKKPYKKDICSINDDELIKTNDSSNEKRKRNSENSFSSYENIHLKEKEKYSFLHSLSPDVPLTEAHADAIQYRKSFKKNREELVKVLYRKYNEIVFNNKLPVEMNISWNPRMTKTAGYCYYKQCSKNRISKIVLSSKVLDYSDKVRDTLIHELCHAASWIVHGYRDGHGAIWKYWARRANQLFPELPTISRCHNYDIVTKYVYKCTRCGGCIGRHSKSLDVKKKVCGRCGGVFELLINSTSGPFSKTPKCLSGFALFVKQNYGIVKKNHEGIKHADIMKKLSAQFSLLSAG